MNTPETIDVYFDFRSPYAYFAAARIARGDIPLPPNVGWAWRPVSINVLLNLQAGCEPTAPYEDPLAPPKRQYVFEDVRHCGAYYDLPFRTPNPIRPNTVPALTALMLLEGDRQGRFRAGVFDALWCGQRNVGDRDVLGDIGKAAGADPAFVDRAHMPEAQEKLIAHTVQAYQDNGIFGVPTFVWRGERFYGADRLDMVHAAAAGTKINSSDRP